MFSLEKTLVFTPFWKGAKFFGGVGAGVGRRLAKLNQNLHFIYQTYVKSICQILASY